MNPTSPDPTEAAVRRRPLLLAGAGSAGVLLGLVFLLTVSGGPADPPPPPSTSSTTVAEPEASEPSPVGFAPELAFAVGRDPFQQLVTVPDPQPAEGPDPAQAQAPAPPPPTPPATTEASAPAGAGATVTDGTAAPDVGTQPPAPPPAGTTVVPPDEEPPTPGYWHHPSPQQPPPGHAPAPQPPPQQHLPQQPPKRHPPQERPPGMIDDPMQLVRWLLEWFRLQWVVTDDAGTSRAVVTMDDHVYLPAEGEVFADHFVVERIHPDCVEVSVAGFDMGICVPTPDQAGDATPDNPTAAQACVVARPALPSAEGADRPRLGLMPCERVAPEVRLRSGVLSSAVPVLAPGRRERRPALAENAVPPQGRHVERRFQPSSTVARAPAAANSTAVPPSTSG
ncbi:MAG: hypothetical protein KY454_00245 [Actinobacteria bacterium]|nr:hypothetical protein [Actinomycetota bacterium]MBW3648973.1 hypothetical protein [Actinomycetota bacterium]